MFEESRERVTTLFPEDVEPVPWLFHSKMIFKRFNAYLQRLRIIDVSFSRDYCIQETCSSYCTKVL